MDFRSRKFIKWELTEIKLFLGKIFKQVGTPGFRKDPKIGLQNLTRQTDWGDARRAKEGSPSHRFTSPWIINDPRLFDLCSDRKPTVTHYQSTVSGIEGGCLSFGRLIQKVVDGRLLLPHHLDQERVL
ncbi:hypothetical protein CEXT_454861 [Caerostris extrusa]|uniref:Uncharacterized protein n=1 Tax=Caerostris extrusa TaxID=172846 RepID=A0AAV4MTL4_CAEEX|nr:hypothetical protein CEXT_454861 [Caerostris extrusa]